MTVSPHEILAMICFARVVEAKSFTAAAEKLGLSKSAVSARIAALEAELKVRLLHRTTRRLALTPEGAALYEHCARVAAAADEATAAFAGAGDTPRGVLRINAPIAFAEDYLTAPLTAYLERFPEVRIELALSDRLVDLVEEGIDVAIRIAEQLRGPGLVARKLAADRTVLCASPAYLARRGTPSSPSELLHHDCLVYSLLKVAEEWRFRERGSKELTAIPVHARFSAASGAVLRRAAVAGMGLAVLPSFMVAEDLAAGRLERVLAGFHGQHLGVFAVHPHARAVPSKVRTFVELLVTHFKTPRW